MRTPLIIAGAVAGLALLACVIIAGTLYTAKGRSLILAETERQIGKQVGGDADIGVLEGPLPGVIELRDVTLTGEDGVWLRIGRVSARWRPAALLRGRIEVDLVEIADATVLGAPPRRPEESDAPSEPFRLPELPTQLPNVSINSVKIRNFRVTEAVAERPYLFDADGAAEISPSSLDVALSIREGGGADTLNFAVSTQTPSAAPSRAIIELEFDSAEDGAFASLVDAEGPISMRASGDAPLSDFRLGLDADIGALINVDATARANLDAQDSLSLIGEARPGRKLAALADSIGPVVTLALTARPESGGVRIEIEDLSAAAGVVSGAIAATADQGGALRSAEAQFQLTPGPGPLAPIVDRLGQSLNFAAQLTPNGDRQLPFGLEARLAAPAIVLSFQDGRTDLQGRLSGAYAAETADLAPLLGLEPMQMAADLRGVISMDPDGSIATEGLSLSLDGVKALTGVATINTQTNDIDGQVSFDFPSELVNAFLQGPEAAGPFRGDLAIAGTLELFGADLAASLPRISVNGGATPPAALSMDVGGLPKSPNARIVARAVEGEGQLTTEFSIDENGDVAAPTLAFTGPNFRFSGNATANASFTDVGLAFTYTGGPGAQPLPNLALVGDAAIEARLDPNNDSVTAFISANRLRAEDIAVEDFNLTINGPFDAAPLEVSLTDATSSGEPVISQLSMSGVVDAAALALRFDEASAFLAGTEFRLTQPTSFAFQDGVSIEGFRVKTGLGGELALDASASASRWRAQLDAANFAPPAAPSLIDASITLDTDKTTPANGRIALRPVFADVDATALTADIVWDGNTVRVRDVDTEESFQGLDLEIAVPVLLARGDRLDVEVGEGIRGRISYEGRAEALAKLGPPETQTLEGDLEFDAEVTGNISAPSTTARLALSNGGYTEPNSGLTLTRMKLDARASANGADGGTLSFSGEAAGAGQKAASIFATGEAAIGGSSTVDMRVTLKDAVVSAQYLQSLAANGEVRLAGAVDALKASGAVQIREMNLELAPAPMAGFTPLDIVDPSIRDDETPSGDAAGPSAEPQNPIALDLKIDAPGQLFVRGLGLESEWRASLSITGSSAAPLVLGEVSLRRGFLDFAGRRFDLSEGEVTFDRLRANNPGLNLVAEYETPTDVLAALNVGGRALAPEITLSSTPSLPNEDVMALILFGKPTQELSALESLQIAQALAQLSGASPFGGGGGLTGGARSALGLDMLNMNFNSPGGSQSLTVGKYVADGLFVSATQSARGDEGAVRVEYELTNSLSVETELKQDGDQTVSANWKTDF